VMGVGESFAEAFVKAQMAAGERLPRSGKVFISVRDADKPKTIDVARVLHELGFSLIATRGTAAALDAAGLPVVAVHKVAEGRPHCVDMIKNGEIAMIINTVEEKRAAIQDSYSIRAAGLQSRIANFPTVAGARAAAYGMRDIRGMKVYDLQGLHRSLAG